MEITVRNDKITIEDATPELTAKLRQLLSYTDKTKQYQIKRMQRNRFNQDSRAIKTLENEVYGCLVEEDDGDLTIPSGFIHLIKDEIYADLRSDTGQDVAYPWNSKPHDLRHYQNDAIHLMEDEYRGLINLATGLGKTLTAVYAIRQQRKRTLIVCPGRSIADNFYKELCNAFGENKVGYYGGGKKKLRDITVGIVGTVTNHLDVFQNHDLGLIIFDEVHHLAAHTFFSIVDELGDVGRIFGLTATDFRSDGKDIMITAGVGPVLIKRDLVWGVKNGWLANPHFIIRNIRTTGREYRDDKLKNYKVHVLQSTTMFDQIAGDIAKMVSVGKRVLCLVDQVEHGKRLAEHLGLPFATGPDKKSTSYVEELNSGQLPGLIGTSKYLGEGTDTKLVDVLVMANFMAGKGPVIQSLGRGLRLYPGKTDLIVLDYVPTGSKMLVRHATQRLSYYREITNQIKVL